MKKLLICSLIIIFSTLFSGCRATNDNVGNTICSGTFTIVKITDDSLYWIVDNQGYLYYYFNQTGAVCPIFNEDGKPMKYVKGNI